MSNPLIAAELGDDADLLLTPDCWLDSERLRLQQALSMLAEQLDAVNKTRLLKNGLQQQNLVPVRLCDVIEISSLPDAVALLDRRNTMDDQQQIRIWESDGYDVRGARKLRSRGNA